MLRCSLQTRRLIIADGISLLHNSASLAARLRPGFSWPPGCARSTPSWHNGPKPLQLKRRFHSSSQLPSVGDTIYALSTAQGRAGIAVIRISGPACHEVYSGLCPGKAFPKPRFAAVRSLYDPAASTPTHVTGLLDAEALVLYFPGPKSVTGEDVLELHIHGGSATVKAVLAAIPRCSSSSRRIRYAEPGEFTKRAFIHDRLDLAQIESLSDTLAAETEQQRRAAVRGHSGALARTYEDWREKLLLARGEIEALIDFSEDQHFDESQSELLRNVTSQVTNILRGIQLYEQGGQRSELLRNGIRIALVGPPNVGKSSLMNLIVGREASIVSGEAGTTRDIVEASLDIRGYLCSFADTAGFRSQDSAAQHHEGLNSGPIGAVEQEGIRRAMQKARDSDVLVIFASVEKGPDGAFLFYDEGTLDLTESVGQSIIVINKIDTVDETRKTELIDQFRQVLAKKSDSLSDTEILPISCRVAQSSALRGDIHAGGVQSVTDALVSVFSQMTEMPVELQDLLGVSERQRQLLLECSSHLNCFMEEAQPRQGDDSDADTVLAAEYLRYAADCLARITGRGEAGDVEDVLGVVFEKFCVGK